MGHSATSALAAVLRHEAKVLQEQFERDFWIDGRGGYYAIALDGDKRQVDSLTSNIGQLLWSGIVPKERAADHRRPPHVRYAQFGLGCPDALGR